MKRPLRQTRRIPREARGSRERHFSSVLERHQTRSYEPERLAAPPAPSLSVHTFDQQTSNCGPVKRRYVSYVPKKLGARTGAPVALVLHGQGASAEAMMVFQLEALSITWPMKKGSSSFTVTVCPPISTIPVCPTRGAGVRNTRSSGRLWTSSSTSANRKGSHLPCCDRRWERRIPGWTIQRRRYGSECCRQRPNAYVGVAAFMPFVGFSATAPQSLAWHAAPTSAVRDSAIDPALPPHYSTKCSRR